ncbi:unnamed protein product [Ilex paraguariensis]|uniref:Uncharacterized protein n=1 Tax=Ilex paraguariensis TaxID=185542 RepID=A0ABC8TIH0_9AQUA
MLISVLVFVMAACFFGEMAYVKPPAQDVLKGMFIPKLTGPGATADAIALLGALVMPHNLFLHSALVLSRKIPNSVRGINDACRFFLIESGFALFVAFLINVSVVSVSGTVCSAKNLSNDNTNRCNHLTLNSASFLLKNVLGKSSSTVYAIALLASEQSSTITGTYTEQYIMQGFLELKMRKWIRNLVTRCIAITPSLLVSIIGGSAGAGRLIIIALMILSFELPFALIPLLKFSSSATKMGPHKNSIYNVLGKSSSTVYAIALLASEQSSTITGTYTEQYIMQGFLELKMRKWIRNLVTRCIAITPSLLVSIIGGSAGAGRLIIIALMILSFELPFALIPLLKFSSSATKMGPHKNSIYIIVFSWTLGLGLIGINIYYLSTGFVDRLIHYSLPKVGNVFIGILVFPWMTIYILTVFYLVFRKDSVVTFIKPSKNDLNAQTRMENRPGDSGGGFNLEPLPDREDPADIPLPQ